MRGDMVSLLRHSTRPKNYIVINVSKSHFADYEVTFLLPGEVGTGVLTMYCNTSMTFDLVTSVPMQESYHARVYF
jgi:hypothetical protein